MANTNTNYRIAVLITNRLPRFLTGTRKMTTNRKEAKIWKTRSGAERAAQKRIAALPVPTSDVQIVVEEITYCDCSSKVCNHS